LGLKGNNSGVVDQAIWRTKLFSARFEEAYDITFVGDVAFDNHAVPAEIDDGLRDSFGCGCITMIAKTYIESTLGSKNCGCRANPSTAASNHHNITHSIFLLRMFGGLTIARAHAIVSSTRFVAQSAATILSACI
jgi:hypothetical protein